ncbi:MAG: hypothetical protein NC409_12440 [Clostridium sp.]|nr:hypothetical protein [Clostridium sp.]
MTLEELIYKRFTSSPELVKYLARYRGAPAVFNSEPPGDDQRGWDGNTQYPEIIYNFDLQANEERHSAGTLSVSLLCQNTAEVTPEAIEPVVRDCLRDVILKPDGGTTYCFAWARTDAFTIGEKKENVTIGSDIRLDILEYPSQETTDPDPVMAVNRYVKNLYPDCLVIGYDRMEEITEATAKKPVIYCQLVSVDKAEETNTVAYMDGRIAVHVLCPDSGIRMKMAAAITNRMSLDGEIIMLDRSPMFIRRLQVNYKSDYLKEGQIFVTCHYGLLRYRAKPHTMTAVHINFKEGYNGKGIKG